MKYVYSLILFAAIISTGKSQSEGYKLLIDIKNIENDRVKVDLFVPENDLDTVIYNMPKIIPGTYSISDFGQFVDEFQALDSKGNSLTVMRMDTNRWMVIGAQDLDRFSYLVNDSFDEPGGAGIFEPGGTNIEAGKNVVLNAFGFAGYIDGAKHVPYEVEILRPQNFYGETSLTRISTGDSIDVFTAKDYFQLHDCPMLYCEPDTAAMYVDDTRIVVSVYSPTGKMKAAEVLDQVDELFPAASAYLGGDLPVNQYSILIYLMKGFGSGGFGALEHNTSTVCVLPEAPINALSQTIKDVTAHEFFHIVTPLNIHSEEIDDYDFVNPVMSKHLWLYEGCTEYAAQHVQVKYDLMSEEDFLGVVKQKMATASQFDSGIAFTELSKKALDEHADQYLNVYQKGALIGMAIDLKLLQLSDAEYGIQDLMADLSKEYGVEKPFQDDMLFKEIGRISGYEEMTAFLEKHVGGTEPLPYSELLSYAGVDFQEETTKSVITGGGVAIGYNPRTARMVVVGMEKMDDFGSALGFEKGDEILEWNGVEVNSENFVSVLDEFRENTSEGEKVKIKVARKQEGGGYKEKTLKGKALTVERTYYNYLKIVDNPTAEQIKVRNAWLEG